MWTRLKIVSIADFCLLLFIWSESNKSIDSAKKNNLVAIIFSATFSKQLSNEITLYNLGIVAFLFGFFKITPIASFQHLEWYPDSIKAL